ncbi:MAG: GDP-L-fucose synthase family protein [Bacteroidota bacterium]
MNKNSKIYIAGHRGLVGSAIMKALNDKGYKNVVTRTHSEIDLTDQSAVAAFFAKEKPEYVFLAAAKVGGIVANNTYRAQFIYENLMIQSNVIHQSYLHGVKKLLFLGSTCIYPRMAPQPMKEEYLLTGVLEETNEPYAIAKIAGLKMCESYNRQYGTRYLSVMPTNLYGQNDNFDLEKSHVLPALIRKIHLGKCLENSDWQAIRRDLELRPVEGVNGKATDEEILGILGKYGVNPTPSPLPQEGGEDNSVANSGNDNPSPQVTNAEGANTFSGKVTVEIWGTGSPLREFMHSTDMAAACVYLMEDPKVEQFIRDYPTSAWTNLGTGEEISIRDLAFLVKDIVGFRGELVFNSSKPDGTPRKLTDVTRLRELGFEHKIGLREGIEGVYGEYRKA